MKSFSFQDEANKHKEKCEELRRIRVRIAENLGIPEKVRQEPCNYEGTCSGTCPACYKEEQILMERIYELYQNGMMDMIYGDKNKELKLEIESIFDGIVMGEAEPLDGDVMEGEMDDSFGEDKSSLENESFNPVKTTYSFTNDENSERLTLPPFRPDNAVPPMSGQILPDPEYFNIKQAENKNKKHGIFGKKDKKNGKI